MQIRNHQSEIRNLESALPTPKPQWGDTIPAQGKPPPEAGAALGKGPNISIVRANRVAIDWHITEDEIKPGN